MAKKVIRLTNIGNTTGYNNITDAITSAPTGSTIICYPGVYSEQVILQDQVNIKLFPGVTISSSEASGTLWDSGSSVDLFIEGEASIYNPNAGKQIFLSHASSSIKGNPLSSKSHTSTDRFEYINGNLNISGSLYVTGSTTLMGTFSASYATTASYAHTASLLLGSITSASYALSSSYAVSASYANVSSGSYSYDNLDNIPSEIVSGTIQISTGSFSGSFKGDGTNLDNVVSASYATTASLLLGSITSASYALSASFATTASYANVTTGSYSYDNLDNIPANIVSGTIQISTGSFSGSFTGDGSNLENIVSSSFAVTSSYVMSASYAPTISSSYSYDNLDNIPANIVSGAEQINTGSFTGSFYGDGSGLNDVSVTTGSYSYDNLDNIPSGIVSSSTFKFVNGHTWAIQGEFTSSDDPPRFYINTPIGQKNTLISCSYMQEIGTTNTLFSINKNGAFLAGFSASTGVIHSNITDSDLANNDYLNMTIDTAGTVAQNMTVTVFIETTGSLT